MLNKYKNTTTIPYENVGNATINSGVMVKVGDKLAVTVSAIPAGKIGAAETEGVYTAVLTSALASSASQGAAVYAPSLPSDGANFTVTSSASAVKVGQLEKSVTSGDKQLLVRI